MQEGTLGSGSKRSRRRGQHGKVNACLEKGLVLFEQFLGLNSEFWEANQNSSMWLGEMNMEQFMLQAAAPAVVQTRH